MDQISQHPRYRSYVYQAEKRESRCQQNGESGRAKMAWAHTPIGSVILVILTALLSLIVKSTIETKPVTNICYQCSVYNLNK